jgi:hypothetical protein
MTARLRPCDRQTERNPAITFELVTGHELWAQRPVGSEPSHLFVPVFCSVLALPSLSLEIGFYGHTRTAEPMLFRGTNTHQMNVTSALTVSRQSERHI